MVVRMATLADGGRITAELVNDEIARISETSTRVSSGTKSTMLETLLGPGYADRYDDFDLAQLAHVIDICRASESAADAARKLFAVSFKAKK